MRRVAGTIAYWTAVLAVSLAITIAFIVFLISRDESSLDPGAPATPTTTQETP